MAHYDDPAAVRDRRKAAYEKRVLDVSRKERVRLNKEAAKQHKTTQTPRLVKICK